MNENNSQEEENLLTEEEIKELNLFTEERRQESIAKYGRDIYAEDRKVGNQKTRKTNTIIDKFLKALYYIIHYGLIILLIVALIAVWLPLISDYS